MPIISICKLILIFSWLKMADVCISPFKDSGDNDINLEHELDANIWCATEALQSVKN
jgi:hypothetical protein